MQTHLAPEFAATPEGRAADEILRKCVHCGFCTATCPTYQLLGDELDSPRGRIYLIKQMLEGGAVTRSTQIHLDRCLTCRNCETTCPSGVKYGALIDIGRQLVDQRVERPLGERLAREALKAGLTSPLFAPALRLGQWVRPLLPSVLQQKVPPVTASAPRSPSGRHSRKVLMLQGCVQPSMQPNIDAATLRVLDAAGIEAVFADGAGCCGAIRRHLGEADGGAADMRRNIDAWWPWIAPDADRGVEAIVLNASGCGLMIKEYGAVLANDPAYAAKAARVSALARDLSELLPDLVPALQGRVVPERGRRLVYHPPCTLQHGQKLRGGVEHHLAALGFSVRLAAAESHLCCGSAGTYSVLQSELATALRDRKLGHLAAGEGECIVSANIGCLQHLQSGTETPFRHWIEVVDESLSLQA